jgi:hypothetical protein
MKKCLLVFTALLLIAGVAGAQTVYPGVDLFETPGLGLTEVDLIIPANLFGSGSDPLSVTVPLRGRSLGQLKDFYNMDHMPMNSLGPTSTIVERLDTLYLTGPGSSDSTTIKIIALRLVSVAPITVTYGGIDPEPWNVQVSLSSVDPQLEGTMTVYQEYDNGGTYEAMLPVTTRVTFTSVESLEEVVLDPGPTDVMLTPPIPLAPLPADACWSYDVDIPIVHSDGTVKVDHDGNEATPHVLVGSSSNFVAGGCGFDAVGNRPTPGSSKEVEQKVHSQEQADLAKHGIQPANPLVHFKVYDVIDEPLPLDTLVTLLNQFDADGAADSVYLDSIYYFENPVEKVPEGLSDTLAHHVWYHIKDWQDPRLIWVDVQNQFFLGSSRLFLLQPEYLLVPADKNLEGFPYMLDHYLAYRVLHGKPANKIVNLIDQWLDEDVFVSKPVWFCTPVDKNGEGIINEVDHLVYYDIEPHMPFIMAFFVNDQFHPVQLPLFADSTLWLGVPTDKLQWGVWFPDAADICSFSATKYEGRIEVAWETASEISSSGFNIHRGLSEDGPDVRINDELIPAKGNELDGASYSFADRDIVDGLDYYYWIESVDVTGVGTMHGPVSVAAADELSVPAAFGLSQNHPNPFNPITEIKYSLPVDCHVTLAVFDVLGRRVATLVNEHQTAGFKSAQWQVTSEVASGVYFYRLQAGSFVETKKMVLLR